MTAGQYEPQTNPGRSRGGMAKPKQTLGEPLRSKLEAALAHRTRGTQTLATLQAYLTEGTIIQVLDTLTALAKGMAGHLGLRHQNTGYHNPQVSVHSACLKKVRMLLGGCLVGTTGK